MSKNILLDILRHASPTLRCSRFACWGHPNPRQKCAKVTPCFFCEHALRRGFSPSIKLPCIQKYNYRITVQFINKNHNLIHTLKNNSLHTFDILLFLFHLQFVSVFYDLYPKSHCQNKWQLAAL